MVTYQHGGVDKSHRWRTYSRRELSGSGSDDCCCIADLGQSAAILRLGSFLIEYGLEGRELELRAGQSSVDFLDSVSNDLAKLVQLVDTSTPVIAG